MSKPIPYETIKNYIENESNSGCILITTKSDYIDVMSKIEIQCKCTNKFETSFSKFKSRNKRQCNECGHKNGGNKNKFSYDYVKNYIEVESSSGCKLLSENYQDIFSNLEILCKCGEVFTTTFNVFKDTHKYQCNKCGRNNYSRKKRTNIKLVVDIIKQSNYKIIRFIEPYKSDRTMFIMQCNDNHQYLTNFNRFKSGHLCPYCAGNAKLNGEFVYNEFLNNGLIPKFKPNEYKNSSIPLPYICSSHIENGIQYKSYSCFKNSKGCKFCKNEIMGNYNRLSQEYVFKIIKDKGLIPLENQVYKNNSMYIKCICLKHPDKIQNICFASFQNNKYGCKYCRYENQSGEKQYNWKGGISDIKKFLRDKILEWKKDSIRNSNYKCVITGEIFDKIHHLYGFDLILEELFNSTNIPKRKNINEYTQEELDILSNEIKIIHNKYSLGVCLKECIHKLFHKEYKWGKNTPEQFEEFKTRLKSGEFNDFLMQNNLHLII